MTTPVDLATVHHEGAGRPRDGAGLTPYTYEIGLTTWTRIQSVYTSWGTLNFNHKSVDICLTGDRDVWPVTPNDLVLIREVMADARGRGEVVDNPYVRDHHDSPGSNTVCPGTNARAPLTWLAIVLACHKEAPPAMPAVTPQFFPPLGVVSFCTFSHPTLGPAAVAIDAAGHVFCEPANAYMGSPYDDHTGRPKPYWSITPGVNRAGAVVTAAAGHGYVIEATTTEKYGPSF